jgi:glycerol-3-phosphate acyltransferase PlsX
MGADHAPKPEVEGAIRAAKTLGVKVLLVGREEVIRRELAQHEGTESLPIEVVHASEHVTMEDSAAKAMRAKRDSSMRVAARLVRDKLADGFVSAGNSGACMVIAKTVLGVVPGVDRPALSGLFPSLKGTPVVVVDVGANVDCSPEMLSQFAVMGEIYSRIVLHLKRPRVGLLSIGEEEVKGNDLTRGATPLI